MNCFIMFWPNVNLFFGPCYRIIRPHAVCCSRITYFDFQQDLHHWLHPLIIFPLRCIMGLRAAQWFLRLARYELVHRRTHPNTLRYCHQLYHTTFLPLFSFLPLICLLFDTWYDPLQLLFGTGKDPPTGSTLHYSARTSSPIFFLLKSQRSRPAAHQPQFDCFITSSSLSALVFQPLLLAWPLPQLSSLIPGSRPSGLPAVFQPTIPSVLQSQHQGSALSIPSHNHTTQAKLASRFLGLAQWVQVCVTPLP